MKNKLFNALYSLNIVFQAIFNLVTPAALFFVIAWLLVTRVGAPEWIYAAAILLGVLIGFYSMIRFVLSATAALERLEKESAARDKKNRKGKNNERK